MESVEDIRRWVQNERAKTPEGRHELTSSGKPQSLQPPMDDAQPLRPKNRPAMAMVCLMDDGGDSGEWVRIRRDEFVIGRVRGDVILSYDSALSAEHVKIYRAMLGQVSQWRIRDLDSTNGTFARVSTAWLKPGQEFLIGMTRFRFDAPHELIGASADPAPSPARLATQGWQAISPASRATLIPSIVELTIAGEGRRQSLNCGELWIGRDRLRCGFVVDNDPFVSACHARVFQDPQGRWIIATGTARNGTWLRFQDVPVEASGEFLAGEQRFQVKVMPRENPA